MHLVDSHCHLDFFDDDEKKAIIDRATHAGLGEVVTIGTRLSNARQQIGITDYTTDHLSVWCTIGTHPEYVMDEPLCSINRIVELTNHPKVIGIGETGLDYFYGKQEAFERQKESFENHIRASQQTGLPVCIHARDADDDIAKILKRETEKGGGFPFLIHCFTSSMKLAETVLDLGGYISISGIITFKKAQDLRDIVLHLPQDKILVETDSPYLAPVPFRGKQNEPAYVYQTAEFMAKLLAVDFETFKKQTTDNFHRLFKKASFKR